MPAACRVVQRLASCSKPPTLPAPGHRQALKRKWEVLVRSVYQRRTSLSSCSSKLSFCWRMFFMNSPMADLPPPPATLCVEGRGQPFSASPASLPASGASPPCRAAAPRRHSRHAKGSSHTKTLGSAAKAPAKAAGPGKQLLTQLAHGEGAQLVQLHDRGHGGEDEARVQRVAARLQGQAGAGRSEGGSMGCQVVHACFA